MIRTYEEIQQVMRRIKAIVHKYIPDAEVKIVPSDTFYAATYIPSLHMTKKIIMQFNKRLVESGTWEQIEDVVAHEIAHVLQADLLDDSAPRSNWHTEEWSDIAQALGSDITMPPFPNVDELQRYKYRCADCGYMTTVSEERYRAPAILRHGRMSAPSSDVAKHVAATGHRKWYVLDELTGRRWTKTH
jgi:predicted SprT family Zn-dependent metalloprotease